MANNKYRADNQAAIANLIINKDRVFFDDDNNKFGAAPPKLISNQPLPFSLANLTFYRGVNEVEAVTRSC
jgi:hypothetical protein